MGRARRARREGIREEPVSRPLEFCASSNPADVGWLAARTARPDRAGGNSREGATGLAWEVTVKAYDVLVGVGEDVAVTMPQG
jgi:hypothetical protein